jgi:DNA-3-methyladenine glycosylase
VCEALGITHKHNSLPLDKAPFDLRARADDCEIIAGVRIGITKAAELPWRYGMRGSRYLSKPIKIAL